MFKKSLKIFTIKTFETKIPKTKKAYTLLEMSIVVSIMAILLTGALGVSVAFVNKSNKTLSQTKIDKIYDAIGKFLLKNKRLPCPANLTLTTSNSLFGVETGNGNGCSGTGVYQSPTATDIYYGAVPTTTLGLAPNDGYDGFGAKISYIIDQRFTRNFQEIPNFTNASFGTVTNYYSSMKVKEKPSSISRDATQDAILVMISHGANKFGAFNRDSSTQNARSSDGDELENDYSASFDSIFVSKSANSSLFDDIVFFKTRNQIVIDFNAFSLIACDNAGTEFGSQSAYYGQTVYGTSACSSLTYTRIPEKYCDRFGVWLELIRCANWP